MILTHARFDDMAALEALEFLEARVPVILMSGELARIPESDARRLGVVEMLEKPFSADQLRQAVRAVMTSSARKIA